MPADYPLQAKGQQAEPAFLVGLDGKALSLSAFNTDLTTYPDRVDIEVSGADEDELIPAEMGKRHFVFEGWLQTDAAVTLTFKSGTGGTATVIGKPVTLKAGDILDVTQVMGQFAQLYTVAGERLAVLKSANATLKGTLWKKTVEVA